MNTHTQASPNFFDRPPAFGFSLSRHLSSLRVCRIKLDFASSSGLVYNATHCMIFTAALQSRLMNSMRLLPLLNAPMQEFLELVRSVPLQFSHRPAVQAPLLVHLPLLPFLSFAP